MGCVRRRAAGGNVEGVGNVAARIRAFFYLRGEVILSCSDGRGKAAIGRRRCRAMNARIGCGCNGMNDRAAEHAEERNEKERA